MIRVSPSPQTGVANKLAFAAVLRGKPRGRKEGSGPDDYSVFLAKGKPAVEGSKFRRGKSVYLIGNEHQSYVIAGEDRSLLGWVKNVLERTKPRPQPPESV